MALDPQTPLSDEPLRHYDQFVALVSNLTSLSLPETEIAVRAVIETVAEHQPEDQRRELADRLPKAMRPWLEQPGAGEQLRHGAFLHRVAEREGISAGSDERLALKAAERHTWAVLDAVRLLLLPSEFEALEQRLPDDARQVLRTPRSHSHALMTAETFINRVANAARFDRERALRATEAVLETLGERLAAGEVSDLEALLPEELRPALELGELHTAGKARRFDAGEFVTLVGEREGGLSYDEALDDTRFVFGTLRDLLPQKELGDVLAELPQGYDDLLGR
jgi:uncharacterized protein (DUF2267 family)